MSARWIVGLALAPLFVGAEGAAVAAPPNVVVILCDDLGFADVGFNGAKDIPTPSLDALAASGVELKQFYGHPDGFQTRAALQTGRYPLRYGFQGVTARSRDENGLPISEITLAELLKEQGYETYLIGSWGLGTDEKYRPLDRGFDHHYGPRAEVIDQYAHTDPRAKLDWYRDDAVSYEEGYSADLLSAEAVKVLEERHGAAPLFIELSFTSPHKPYQAPQKYIQDKRFQTDPKPERRSYQTSVAAMDAAIGTVTAEIEKLGITGDTVVFFLSDNGGDSNNGVANNTPLRGSAGSDQTEKLYDGALRTPALMAWPGKVKAGEMDTVSHPVDIFTTILTIAGGSPESDIDGKDLRRLAGSSPRTIPLEISKKNVVVRSGQWKLIAKKDTETTTTTTTPSTTKVTVASTLEDRMTALLSDDPSTWTPTATELYDLETDPSETTNVAAANPDVVNAIVLEIRDYLAVAQPPGTPGGAKGKGTNDSSGSTDGGGSGNSGG